MKALVPFILVGVGGMGGSVTRYLLTILMRDIGRLPYGTLASNCAGCFIAGMISALTIDIPLLSSEARLLLATGFCGGFTTLSSLMYETAQQVRDSEYVTALLYVGGTLAGAGIAFVAGMTIIKLIYRG